MKFLAICIMMLTAATAFADIYDDLGRTAEKNGAEKALTAKLAERTRAAGYSPESISAIENALSAQIGMSATRVSEKVLEGIAKRVQQQAVANAALKVRARYETAYAVAKQIGLKGRQAENTADIAADALAAGANEASMTKTAKHLSTMQKDREQYAVAVMAFYRDMLRYGVKETSAASIADESLDNLSADQITEYRHYFMKNAGSNAQSMAESMHDSIEHGNSASSMGSGGHSGSSGHSSGSGGSGGDSGGGGHGGGGHGGKH
ncbi:hypothetical protein [Sphaerochaeta sp.]|uniref:hypothetical protein n=1 Tax=Sphaerochaeta sp. TaxID=1972642 RepID=UPI003D11DE30